MYVLHEEGMLSTFKWGLKECILAKRNGWKSGKVREQYPHLLAE
jgi:hypothetical protein